MERKTTAACRADAASGAVEDCAGRHPPRSPSPPPSGHVEAHAEAHVERRRPAGGPTLLDRHRAVGLRFDRARQGAWQGQRAARHRLVTVRRCVLPHGPVTGVRVPCALRRRRPRRLTGCGHDAPLLSATCCLSHAALFTPGINGTGTRKVMYSHKAPPASSAPGGFGERRARAVRAPSGARAAPAPRGGRAHRQLTRCRRLHDQAPESRRRPGNGGQVPRPCAGDRRRGRLPFVRLRRTGDRGPHRGTPVVRAGGSQGRRRCPVRTWAPSCWNWAARKMRKPRRAAGTRCRGAPL